MLTQHARTSVPHDRSDLFAPEVLIAMDGTLGTDGLLCAESAALEPEGGIIQKLPALRAKAGTDLVVAPAVTADHCGHGLEFPGETLGDRSSAASAARFILWPEV